MTNKWLLENCIKYISDRSLALSAILPAKDMEKIYRIGMRIIWICDDVLRYNARDLVNSMPPLDIDLLKKSKYLSFGRTLEAFYNYLCEWRIRGLVTYTDVFRYPPGDVVTPEVGHYYAEGVAYRFDLDY